MIEQLRPRVIERVNGEDWLEYLLEISLDNAIYAGHFPGLPVLPGVVQVGWAIELAEPLEFSGHHFNSVQRLKFMRPIVSDRNIRLKLTSLQTNKCLKFKYHSDQISYSSGQILFGNQHV